MSQMVDKDVITIPGINVLLVVMHNSQNYYRRRPRQFYFCCHNCVHHLRCYHSCPSTRYCGDLSGEIANGFIIKQLKYHLERVAGLQTEPTL